MPKNEYRNVIVEVKGQIGIIYVRVTDPLVLQVLMFQ
jgi:hypothetical protein